MKKCFLLRIGIFRGLLTVQDTDPPPLLWDMELVSFARGDDATVAFRITEVFCGSESIRFFCLFAFPALRNVGKFLYDLVSCLVS